MRISDWSSDVCSSDLAPLPRHQPARVQQLLPALSRPLLQCCIKLPGGNVVGLRRCLFRGSCRQRCSSTGAHHQNGVENRCAQRIVHVASPGGCVFRRSHHTPRRDGIGSSTTGGGCAPLPVQRDQRSEEHTSELQSLMSLSYA